MAIYTRRNAITFCAVWLVGGMLLVGEKDDAGLAGSLAEAEVAPQAAQPAVAGPAFTISTPVASPPAAQPGPSAWDAEGGAAETGPPTVHAATAPNLATAPQVQPLAAGPGNGVVIAASYRGQSAPLPSDRQHAARAALAEDLRLALP